MFAAATETPRGERAHAVGARVDEGHGPASRQKLPYSSTIIVLN
jgi:hypothetical protein